jgi:hypothetical protein
MNVLIFQAAIRFQGVREKLRASLSVLSYLALERLFAAISNDLVAYPAVAFKQSHHGYLV